MWGVRLGETRSEESARSEDRKLNPTSIVRLTEVSSSGQENVGTLVDWRVLYRVLHRGMAYTSHNQSVFPFLTLNNSREPDERREESGNGEQKGEYDILPTQEDHQARFYDAYRKEAEDYDRESMK